MTPPSPEEIRSALTRYKEARPWAYAHVDLDSWFVGYLMGQGWPAADADEFVANNAIVVDS